MSARGMMIDFKLARQAMIDSQIKTAGVTDRRLLAALAHVPREFFVAPDNRSFVYMDGPVPVAPAGAGVNRYLMQPMVLARLIQQADLDRSEHVLVVGCTTGYSLAVLAELAGSVVGVECDATLAAEARANLAALEIGNATVVVGPLAEGAPADGPFDLVFLDGSVPALPSGLVGQVKDGGRIAAIIANSDQGTAYLFTVSGGEARGLPEFAAGAKALPGFVQSPAFNF